MATEVNITKDETEVPETPETEQAEADAALTYSDNDDMPNYESIEHVETDYSGEDTGAGQSPTQALLEALKAPVNQDAVKEAISGLYLESGTYKWVEGKCEVAPILNQEDRKAGDISPAGRLQVSVMGS